MSDGPSRPQFGGRFLVNPEDVFQHNAWDNVVWGEEQEQKAQDAVARNSEVTLTAEQIQSLEDEAAHNWDKFYNIHQNKFFKNRNWLFTEFPELALYLREKLSSPAAPGKHSQVLDALPAQQQQENIAEGSSTVNGDGSCTNHSLAYNSPQDTLVIDSSIGEPDKDTQPSLPSAADVAASTPLPVKSVPRHAALPAGDTSNHTAENKLDFPGADAKFRILEVGCGVGNTIFPVLETNPESELFMYGADFSSTAIDIVRQHEEYDQKRCHAFVLDITDAEWSAPFPACSLDVITCIYVLSAVHPDAHVHVARQLFMYLKPGGVLLLRDYGRYDLTQLRFKKGKCLADNYYVRGDGTKSYFFTQEEIREVFLGAGFKEKQNIVDRRLQVNRGKQLTMYRVWVQAKYTKPVTTSEL